METRREYKGAGGGKRIGAYLIDNIIISALGGAIGLLLLGGSTDDLMTNLAPTYYITAAVTLLYGALLEQGKKHATLGKRMFGLTVVGAQGEPLQGIDYWYRNCLKALPNLLMGLFAENALSVIVSLAWTVILFVGLCNKQKRCAYDYLAHTLVVTKKELEEAEALQRQEAERQRLEELRQKQEEEAKRAAQEAEGETRTAPSMFYHPLSEKWYLKGLAGQYAGMNLELSEQIIMGREAKQCNLVFEEATPGVSRVHLRIYTEGGNCVKIEDMGSSYGTFLEEKKLVPYESVLLSSGDVIRLGQQERFCVVKEAK